MNRVLKKSLHAQLGITDKNWLQAIETSEYGFNSAANFIAKTKGKTLLPVSEKEKIDTNLRE